MLTTITRTITRWRTWLFNAAAALAIALPDIVSALIGYNWGDIIPPKYLPLVTLGILVVNIWMRPRPAVLAHEVEANK